MKLQAWLGWRCRESTCSAGSRGGGVVVLCRVASCSCLHPLGFAILGSQACSMHSPMHQQGLLAYLEAVLRVLRDLQVGKGLQPVGLNVAGSWLDWKSRGWLWLHKEERRKDSHAAREPTNHHSTPATMAQIQPQEGHTR